MVRLTLVSTLALCTAVSAAAAETTPPVPQSSAVAAYELGPDDELSVWVEGVEDFKSVTVRIGMDGYVDLPLAGRVKAAGKTLPELQTGIVTSLREYIIEPRVGVSVKEYRSQPVSVLGAVQKPGVHQIQGRKTLAEVLALAEGIRPEAGYSVRITRRLDQGTPPLPGAKLDETGKFTVATVPLKSIIDGANPEANIAIKPYDVITVPRGGTIYVIGDVKKAGGFVLQERESLSLLQALALAEGSTQTASKHLRILRQQPGGAGRTEIAVDLNRILTGKDRDLVLKPEDILFVPTSQSKHAGVRGLETALQIATGVVIWRR